MNLLKNLQKYYHRLERESHWAAIKAMQKENKEKEAEANHFKKILDEMKEEKASGKVSRSKDVLGAV